VWERLSKPLDHLPSSCEACRLCLPCPRPPKHKAKPRVGQGGLYFIRWTFIDENDHVHDI
jgi:hypothetical protein